MSGRAISTLLAAGPAACFSSPCFHLFTATAVRFFHNVCGFKTSVIATLVIPEILLAIQSTWFYTGYVVNVLIVYSFDRLVVLYFWNG